MHLYFEPKSYWHDLKILVSSPLCEGRGDFFFFFYLKQEERPEKISRGREEKGGRYFLPLFWSGN